MIKVVRVLLGSLNETRNVFIIFSISAKSHNLVFGILKPHYPGIQNAIDEMNYIEKLGHFAASKSARV